RSWPSSPRRKRWATERRCAPPPERPSDVWSGRWARRSWPRSRGSCSPCASFWIEKPGGGAATGRGARSAAEDEPALRTFGDVRGELLPARGARLHLALPEGRRLLGRPRPGGDRIIDLARDRDALLRDVE